MGEGFSVQVLLGAAGAVAVVALILAIVALVNGRRVKRRLRKWQTIHETADLEKVYQQTVARVSELEAQLTDMARQLDEFQEQLRRKVTTARVLRYNAFAETGSDLSFSLALLDDHQDGVVVSSIYGRDESRTYAKPVYGGSSPYPLTEEELAVMAGERQLTRQ
ncbi:MAG: DUF4446 family protein [Alicyclobacillus sp.]|nr:DUF4446 family protein [Alicyclobacillus sp.]